MQTTEDGPIKNLKGHKTAARAAGRKRLGEGAAKAVSEHVNASNIQTTVDIAGGSGRGLRDKVLGAAKKVFGNGPGA